MGTCSSSQSVASCTDSNRGDCDRFNEDSLVVVENDGATTINTTPEEGISIPGENIGDRNDCNLFNEDSIVVADNNGATAMNTTPVQENSIPGEIMVATEPTRQTEDDADHPSIVMNNSLDMVVLDMDESERQMATDDASINSQATSKPCCGKPCQLRPSELCCEHSFFTHTSPERYCPTCKARYQANDGTCKETPPDVCTPSAPTHPDEEKERELLPFEKLAQICQAECPVCLIDFSVISGALVILPCAHVICHGHRHKIHACPLCRHPIDDSGAKEDAAIGAEQSSEYMSQTERYNIINSATNNRRRTQTL